MARVSAETITALTSSASFHNAGNVPTPPSADILIDRIGTRLRTAARDAQHKADTSEGPDRARALSNLQAARHHERQFDKLLETVPQGFRLVPVFFARISSEQNARVHREYITHVRPRFFQFLAENYADELTALGICEHGIDRMRKGLDPASAENRYYEVNVDHIIERSGSGAWSEATAEDADDADAMPRLMPNHFGNLTLLPESVHEYKNALNEIQSLSAMQDGSGRWCLMMIPERNDRHSGFVCPPQQREDGHYALRFRTCDFSKKISYAAFTVDQTSMGISMLAQNPAVAAYFQESHKAMNHQKKCVANDNDKGNLPCVAQDFAAIVKSNAGVRRMIETRLAPAMAEAAAHIRHVFNQAAFSQDSTGSRSKLHDFNSFWHGKSVARLRQKLHLLPLKEAQDLTAAFRAIDRDLGTRIQKKPRAPAPQTYQWSPVAQEPVRVPFIRKKKRNGSRPRPPQAGGHPPV